MERNRTDGSNFSLVPNVLWSEQNRTERKKLWSVMSSHVVSGVLVRDVGFEFASRNLSLCDEAHGISSVVPYNAWFLVQERRCASVMRP